MALLLLSCSLWFMEYTLIGVVVSMFVIGTLLLCVGHVSTEPTSRHMFQTTKKNMCAQGLNVFVSCVNLLCLKFISTYCLDVTSEHAWYLFTFE